jgi:peptidoglycan/LPS O-acetylase OafA/YrhL
LLVRALHRPGWAGSRYLQFLGRYCYGLYVFNGALAHVLGAVIPVTVFPTAAGSLLPGLFAFVMIGLILNIGIAVLSWHGFEKQFLRLKSRFSYGPEVHKASTPVMAS